LTLNPYITNSIPHTQTSRPYFTALTAALRGADAVVSCVGTIGTDDAAMLAGTQS